ncbi:MAG: 2-octaprenyl-6-methoxyphenyl hydroxylase [Steroidobacteraceae bacterium]
MNIPPQHFDIAVVGGGLVGASLAAALRTLPLRVALIEAHAPDSAAQPSFDERTTALGNASRRVFEALGLWQALRPDAAPIEAIHVSDAGRYAFARLTAREFGQEALGYVVPNRVLGRELWRALGAAPNVTPFMPARLQSLHVGTDMALLELEQAGEPMSITAALVVAADGAQSLVRAAAGLGATVDDYEQVAIVASLRSDQANDGVAYERFTAAGPMALLPLRVAGSSSWRTLVWAARPADADRLMQLPAAQFMHAWQDAFGWRAGRALQLGHRGRYPLSLSRSEGSVAPRIVLLGNAAQSLHPVAGQGFNLGLRDAAELADLLSKAVSEAGDIAAPELLAQYAAGRVTDRAGVIGFTDTLVRVFSSGHPLAAAARDAGMLLFDLLPPAKRALSRVSLGFGARSPRLTRGLPLGPPGGGR